MRVNLAKKETGVFSLSWIRVGVTVLIFVLIAGIAYNYYFLTTRKEILNQEIDSLDQQLRVLNPKQEEYLNLRTQVSQLEESIFPQQHLLETEDGRPVIEIPLERELSSNEADEYADRLAAYMFEQGHNDFDIEISADDVEVTDEITLENDEDFYEEFGILGYVPDDPLWEAEYDGKKVKLNQPMRGDVKKFKVYVNSGDKTADGKVKAKKVNFGSDKMEIKRDDPEARRSFRARHNCDNPGPKHKARYWSCKKW